MNIEQLLAALKTLPPPDLIDDRTAGDLPGSKELYRARTVARLVEAARNEASRENALALWDSLSEQEKTYDCASSLRAMLLMGPFGDEIRAIRFGMEPLT